MAAALEIPLRKFGRHDEYVSALALGGYHLGSVGSEREAIRIVHTALDAGLTFMDNAWDYHRGKSEIRMGRALKGRRDRAFLMTKVCTHGRDARVAMRQLEQSLRRLQTDYLDLWQVHECVYYNDPERHFARDGAVEALEQAKRDGKVRYVGFTGHKDPAIHLKMLSYDYAFDACLMPLNCFDSSFRSFERDVLPVLLRRRIAPLGMKSLGGDARSVKAKAVTPQEAIRYTLSLPIATLVSGIDTMRVLRQNLAIAQGFRPMTSRQRQTLLKRVAPKAEDGRFELYKISAAFDGNESRRQHGLPLMDELSA